MRKPTKSFQDFLEECWHYLILSDDLEYGNTLKWSLKGEEINKLLDVCFRSILSPNSCLLTPVF